MSRIVLVFQKTINGSSLVSLAEPAGHEKAQMVAEIDVSKARGLLEKIRMHQMPLHGVRDLGTELLEMLKVHPAISEAVLPLLTARQQEEEPIYLWIKGPNPDLEDLPWEALYVPDVGFLSANKLFPVARAEDAFQPNAVVEFIPPLKIMTVLGTSGQDDMTRISAQQEWEGIYAAVMRSKLNISLHALVCEKDLLAKIKAIHDEQPWIDGDLLVDREELFGDIRRFAPHILHFFCHGISYPVPQLHVASYKNWLLKEPGDIQIEDRQLQQRADPGKDIWLVSLNCCESAQWAQAPGSHTVPMALALVKAGFPAVVGMRDRVDQDLANDFSGLFYDELLNDLAARFREAEKKRIAEVHWACGLFAARQRICARINPHSAFSEAAADAVEWTIPVLYTRLQSFQIQVAAGAEGRDILRSPARPRKRRRSGQRGLSSEQIRRLADEMEELTNLKEQLGNPVPVVQKINARLARIGAALKA
jgi:hypothetical protein